MTYNTRSPAVKRLMKEAQELSTPTELFFAKPLEDNLFEWHFTIRGPTDTDYDGGIYHGRILLPAEYPMKPPNILLLTPSGRFEVNRKICLSISGYHPETWRPSWSIRTALLAIIGFMPTHGVGAIGSLDYPPEERRKLAKSSVDYLCSQCGEVKDILKSLTEASVVDVEEARSLASQISFTGDKEGTAIVPATTEAQSNAPASPPQGPAAFSPAPLSPWQSPLQPLSFGDWCKHARMSAASPVTPPPVIALPPRPPVTPPPLTHAPAPLLAQEPAPLPSSAQSPLLAPAAVSMDVVLLRQRQAVLVQCMVVVAGLLGLFLAVRLGSLGEGL